jgi:hypothetical protein
MGACRRPGRQAPPGPSRPSLALKFTREARDAACIFSITPPRCAFTVDLADAQFAAHLLVHEACDDEVYDFAFPAAEGLVTLAQGPQGGLFADPLAAAVERRRYRGQEFVGAEGLGEEFYGAGLHRPDGHRHVAIAGDENNGHLGTGVRDADLQVEAAQIGQAHIQHKAVEPGRGRGGEDGFGGVEGPRFPARRSDQALHRLPHRHVVIDDKHYGLQIRHGRSFPVRVSAPWCN